MFWLADRLALPGHVARACAAAAAASGIASALAAQDGLVRPSALVKMSSDEPLASIARAADPHFAFVSGVEHYDGVYYYAIALDPFARGRAHTLIDQAPYRYGHPLHGWLAGLLSLGNAAAVPAALFLLSIAGLAVAAWALSRLAANAGRSPWLGLAVAVLPGLLYAVTVSTSETVGAALVLSALLSWQYERWWLATVLLCAVCLDKEPYVAVPIGLLVWELVQWRRRGRPDRLAQRGVAVAAGPVLLLGWFCYVHATLHHWPISTASGNIGRPIAGWGDTLRYAHYMSAGSFDQSQIGALTPPILIALATLLLAATVAALRMRSVSAAPLLGLVAMTACQGWRTLLYPHEIFRTPAVATVVAVAVLATTQLSGPHARDQNVGQLAGPPEERRMAAVEMHGLDTQP